MTSTPINVTVGQEVLVRIAGRIVPAIIEETLPDGWMVKSIASGKTSKLKSSTNSQRCRSGSASHRSSAVQEPAMKPPSTAGHGIAAKAHAPGRCRFWMPPSKYSNWCQARCRDMVKLAIERGLCSDHG